MKQNFYENEEHHNEFSTLPERDEVSITDLYTHHGKVISKHFKEINVRKSALPNGEVVAVVKVGTKLSYIPEQEDEFYPVLLENGQTGYMMVKFIEEVADE